MLLNRAKGEREEGTPLGDVEAGPQSVRAAPGPLSAVPAVGPSGPAGGPSARQLAACLVAVAVGCALLLVRPPP
eukprot:397268-Prorocentrum_minimum.AAC.1